MKLNMKLVAEIASVTKWSVDSPICPEITSKSDPRDIVSKVMSHVQIGDDMVRENYAEIEAIVAGAFYSKVSF